MATMLLVILSLAISMAFLGGFNFDASLEQAEEESKDTGVIFPATGSEGSLSAERTSNRMVLYTNKTPDGSFQGNLKRLHKFNVSLGCDALTTHEVGTACLIDSLKSWQWVENGCEVGLWGANLGWFKFKVHDNHPDPLVLEYSCVGSDDRSNPGIGCYGRYRWVADTWKYNPNEVKLVTTPSNKTKIDIYYWDMDEPAPWDGCKKERCGGNKDYCRNNMFHNYYGWGIEAKGRILCPPEEVRKTDGNLVLDDGGNKITEKWVWDDTHARIGGAGTCCIETDNPDMYCRNQYCEDVQLGVWRYGRCWIKGTGTCNAICSSRPRKDGTNYVCDMPDYNWARVERGCEFHEMFGIDCNNCNPSGFGNRLISPFVNTLTNNCVYEDDYSVGEAAWCAAPSGGNRERLCPCL